MTTVLGVLKSYCIYFLHKLIVYGSHKSLKLFFFLLSCLHVLFCLVTFIHIICYVILTWMHACIIFFFWGKDLNFSFLVSYPTHFPLYSQVLLFINWWLPAFHCKLEYVLASNTILSCGWNFFFFFIKRLCCSFAQTLKSVV